MDFRRIAWRRSWLLIVVGLALALALAAPALAQDPNLCDQAGEAPDVIVGDLHEVIRWGKVGSLTGFSVGTVSCNIGTCWLNWISATNDHPVIAQNIYRLKDGRLEQIGQSWLKHGFFALSETECDTGCVSTTGDHLGVNCSDPYSANLNGNQNRLGPRSEVNAYTGEFTYPFSTQNQTGDPIYKRMQVHDDDLDPAMNVGAKYFVEGQYVTKDDSAAGNGLNNVSWRRVQVLDGGGGFYDLQLDSLTYREGSVLFAWQIHEPTVRIGSFTVAGDGEVLVGSTGTDLGGGIWRYVYAVHNKTSHRSGKTFSVDVPEGATVTNIGFHDIDYHSGEPYDGTDWAGTHDEIQNRVIWSTEAITTNPDANALRWGTVYTFWFDVDAPRVTTDVTLGYFRPGTPGEATAVASAPDVCNADGICDLGEDCTNCAADCVDVGQGTCCGDMICDGNEDSCICAADCGAPPAIEMACTDTLDEDCDGQTDCDDLDCCTDGACVTGIDADSDSVAECDCDDNNDQISETPGEVTGLEFSGKTSLQWSAALPPGGVTPRYDLLRTSDPTNFLSPAYCLLGPAHTTLGTTDSDVPLSGLGYYYLVRAWNDCPDSSGPLGVGRLGRSCH